MKYVTPEYEQKLNRLAELLCTPERFGRVAVEAEFEQPVLFEVEGE